MLSESYIFQKVARRKEIKNKLSSKIIPEKAIFFFFNGLQWGKEVSKMINIF